MKLRPLEALDLADKSVFLRLDLNVPMSGGEILDDTRIRAALPTLNYILEKTNRLVVASHLGRPGGKVDASLSLGPVGIRLAEFLDREVVFVDDYFPKGVERILPQLDQNQFILLENLRFHGQETANDKNFSRILALGIDYYINDAFGTAHRAHASTEGLAGCLLPEKRAAGFLMESEVKNLGQLLENPSHPYSVVIGGAKVSDKIGVMLNLLANCNHLLIGGAMAYTFLKFRGFKVGKSRVEEDKLELVDAIYRNAESRKVAIHLPEDHVAAETFDKAAPAVTVDGPDIPNTLMGLDIGPKTVAKFREVIRESKTILWNGPMGVFEWPAFAKGTMEVAQAIALHGQLPESPVFTLVGGGDSVAALNQAGVGKYISHISTGGGASLEFLEGKLLPGLAVLKV